MARQKLAKMTPGAYVVVHGNIKEYDGRLTISAYDMRPVEDFNQVTHHYLEAIYVHAKRVGKIQVSSGAAAAPRSATPWPASTRRRTASPRPAAPTAPTA